MPTTQEYLYFPHDSAISAGLNGNSSFLYHLASARWGGGLGLESSEGFPTHIFGS